MTDRNAVVTPTGSWQCGEQEENSPKRKANQTNKVWVLILQYKQASFAFQEVVFV